MKRALTFALVVSMFASADDFNNRQPAPAEVIHVATALDHLTVLEFGEPVTMAASGSSAFQIERRDDKVFIKPLKPGAATDLFVWTATRRFTYELAPPGEVKDMNFAVDSPAPKPAPAAPAQLDRIADMMLTRAFLDAERMRGAEVRNTKGRVTVHIEHVFQSSNTLYIHYAMRNLTSRPYRIAAPAVSELGAARPWTAGTFVRPAQLTRREIRKLGELKLRPIAVAHAEVRQADLQPGQESQGIVAIRQPVATPAMLQLTFGAEGKHAVEAVVVF